MNGNFPIFFGKNKQSAPPTPPFDPTAVSGFLMYFDTTAGKLFKGIAGAGGLSLLGGDVVGSIQNNVGDIYASRTNATEEGTLRLTTGPNGYRYIEMNLATSLNAGFTLTQPFTRFDVFRLRSGYTLANYWIDGFNGASALTRPYPVGNLSLYAGGSSAPQAPFSDDTWIVTCSLFSGASSIISVNGGTEVTGNPGTDNPGGWRLNNAGFSVTGDWVASWFYNVALSGTNRTNVVNYLKSKYGT